MISTANINDLNKIVKLYEDTTEYLAKNINYPNWKKHEYPNESTANNAILEKNIYIYTTNNEICASIIINQFQPVPYKEANWLYDLKDSDVIVIHTLVVHPNFSNQGIGKKLISFAEKLGREKGLKSIRLDTFEENIPAQKLYESLGYIFCGKINLKPAKTTKLYKTYEKKL